MKRTLFLCIAAILISGCASEGPAGKGPSDGLDQESGDETGNLFGNQPGDSDEGIPLEDDAAGPADRRPAAPNPAAAVIRPVRITRGRDLGTCVIGEECEKRISAKGGSGEYVWTLVEGGLPEGLEIADTESERVKIQKTSGQEIDEVGEFTFTLRVEDAADATRSAEKAFALRINEHIAMDLYTMAGGEGDNPVWQHVQGKDKGGNDVPITVPVGGILLVEAVGHAESYRWSINGEEVVCNKQACWGIKDGLKLYRDTSLTPPNPLEHYDYMILKAEEDFIGIEQKDVVISVADDFGDEASKVISSLTFQQDPCKIPIVLAGSSTATANRGEEYSFAFTVSGGKAPYSWFHTNADGNLQSATFSVSDATFTFSGRVPSDATPGRKIERAVVVKDSCPYEQEHPAKVTVVVDVQCRLGAVVNHVDFHARYANGHGDADTCGQTEASFGLRLRDGPEIGNTGHIHIDVNGNDVIDDLSPSYDMRLDGEYCVEDIGQFTWWLEGDDCMEYLDVFLDTVLVEAGGFFAGWHGTLGESDLGANESWTRDFNMTCDETSELWCAVNPYPDYRSWHE